MTENTDFFQNGRRGRVFFPWFLVQHLCEKNVPMIEA